MYIADLLIDVYTVESALLRAMAAQGASRASLHGDAARVLLNDAAARIEVTARQSLAAMVSGDTLRTMLAGLKRLSKFVPFDTVTLRRRLADAAVAQGGYTF
jgi:butyryl-CoA dehydrogenase